MKHQHNNNNNNNNNNTETVFNTNGDGSGDVHDDDGGSGGVDHRSRKNHHHHNNSRKVPPPQQQRQSPSSKEALQMEQMEMEYHHHHDAKHKQKSNHFMQQERHLKRDKPTNNNKFHVPTTRRHIQTTMLSTDWLADMVNNNHQIMNNNNNNNNNGDGDNDDEDEYGGSDGGGIVKQKQQQQQQQQLGPVMQLINVSIYSDYGHADDNGNGGGIITSGACCVSKSSYCFESLNLTFTCGRIFVLIGEARSGKTALLQTIAKMRPPARGKVQYLGPPGTGSNYRLSIGYLAQHNGGYFEAFDAVENLHYISRLLCVPEVVMQNKLHRLMQIIGWDRKNVPIGALRPVEQSIVSLAIASLHSPAILLLDEPNFGADLFLKENIWRQLRTLTIKEHVTIVFSTTFVEDVRFADEAAIIRARSLFSCALSPTVNMIEKPLDTIAKEDDHHESSGKKDFDLHSLLTIDVDKIRQYVAQSYQLEADLNDISQVEKPPKEEKKKKLGLFNFGFDTRSTTALEDDVRLEMSWSSSNTSCSALDHAAQQYYAKQSKSHLKRIHREASPLVKIGLVWLLLLKLCIKRPFRLAVQLLFPALIVTMLDWFVGQNPYNIRVAVYNPDQPSIVSRLVLRSFDSHTIKFVEYDTLENALDAVRQHQVWGAMEFPANYTNSMINRALENCDGNADEFDEEPEAESISGHLLEPTNVQLDRLTSATLVNEQKKSSRNTRSLEREEEKHNNNNGNNHQRDTRSGTTNAASTENIETTKSDETETENDTNSSSSSGGGDKSEENGGTSIDEESLMNDLEVNRKKSRPVNMITIRLYMDNTNLLVSGFVKGKLLQALQKAQKDPSIQQFAPKIPPPVELVSPSIYGNDESPMSHFLFPGTLVAVMFLCSSIIPLPLLSISMCRNSPFEMLQIVGIDRATVLCCFIGTQLIILGGQTVLILSTTMVVLVEHNSAQFTTNSQVVLTFGILYLQGCIALLLSILIYYFYRRCGQCEQSALYTMLSQTLHFAILIMIGGLFWPLEAYPVTLQSIMLHCCPQTLGAEMLRYILNRDWSLEQYYNPTNDIVWYGVNVPLLWITTLVLFILVLAKYY